MIRDARFGFRALPLALVAAVILIVGCSKKPTDAQLEANVQKQIAADSALQGQPISVAASNGVVTLTGTVDGPGLRELASNDAAKVSGVKTVVNNLAMANGQEAGQPPVTDQSGQGGSASAPPPPPPAAGGQANAGTTRASRGSATDRSACGNEDSGQAGSDSFYERESNRRLVFRRIGGFGAGEWANGDSGRCAGEGRRHGVEGTGKIQGASRAGDPAG